MASPVDDDLVNLDVKMPKPLPVDTTHSSTEPVTNSIDTATPNALRDDGGGDTEMEEE